MDRSYSFSSTLPNRQGGAVLILSLIMMTILIAIITGLSARSKTTFQSVSNMQMRSQALAAANFALEQVINSDFTAAPAAETVIVDINNSGTTDYTASISAPVCIRASKAAASAASSVTLASVTSTSWNTLWEFTSTVADPVGGANVIVHAGINVVLTNAEKNAVCS